MDFGTCRECNEYNYLERDGLCASCAPSRGFSCKTVYFSAQLSSKPSLKNLLSTIESVNETRDSTILRNRTKKVVEWSTADAEIQISQTGSVTARYELDSDISNGEKEVRDLLSKVLSNTPALQIDHVDVETSFKGSVDDSRRLARELKQSFNPNLTAKAGSRVILDDPNLQDISRIAVSNSGNIVLRGPDKEAIEQTVNGSNLSDIVKDNLSN